MGTTTTQESPNVVTFWLRHQRHVYLALALLWIALLVGTGAAMMRGEAEVYENQHVNLMTLIIASLALSLSGLASPQVIKFGLLGVCLVLLGVAIWLRLQAP